VFSGNEEKASDSRLLGIRLEKCFKVPTGFEPALVNQTILVLQRMTMKVQYNVPGRKL